MRYADIRLNIPYNEFMEADKEKEFEYWSKRIYMNLFELFICKLNKKNGM